MKTYRRHCCGALIPFRKRLDHCQSHQSQGSRQNVKSMADQPLMLYSSLNLGASGVIAGCMDGHAAVRNVHCKVHERVDRGAAMSML